MTKSIKMSYDQAKALLRKAVEEKGAEYVYPRSSDGLSGCVYFNDDGTPSCIVGQALSYEGVTAADMAGQNEVGAYSLMGGPLGYEAITRAVEIRPTDRLVEHLLTRAQARQDSGTPWGEAVEEAIAFLDNMSPERAFEEGLRL